MSKARLVITAVVHEQRRQAEVARAYGVSQGWVSKLVARYRAEGEAAFEPRSRRPKTSTRALAASTVELILRLRKGLAEQGLDAGADTIGWHLTHHHGIAVSRATINRRLHQAGLVDPEPKKRPKSSYIRFEADHAQRDLAVRLHPLPAHRRHRRRDHHLARRLHPLRPARSPPTPGSPARSCWPRSAKPLPHTGSPPPP